MPLSTAKSRRVLLVGLGAQLALTVACLPQDDLSSYSRDWTGETAALSPAPLSDMPSEAPSTVDASVPAAGNGASDPPANGGTSQGPNDLPALSDAGVLDTNPVDGGADAAVDVGDASTDDPPAPSAADAGGDAGAAELSLPEPIDAGLP